jgi:hypothetical protein
MGHPRIKHRRGPATRDSINIAKGADQWVRAMVTVEAHTQSNLRTIYTTVMPLTTAPKIAPSSWTKRRKWIKIPRKPHSNPHLEKSTTPCNGTHILSNTLHPIFRSTSQVYQTTQAPPPAYYQSYHYATTNHLQPL